MKAFNSNAVKAVLCIGLFAWARPVPPDTATVAVSATVISRHNCRFTTASAALSFGAINAGGTADVSAGANLRFRCIGNPFRPVVFLVSQDHGLHKDVGNRNRMQNVTATTEFLPYTLTLSPETATTFAFILNTVAIGGTIRVADFQNAYAGSYSDTVILTINP